MDACEYFQGQVAAALYEPLTPQEQAELQAHLEACADCRAEQQALSALVQAIPVIAIPFEEDLLPILRRKLFLAQRRNRWSWAAAAAAVFIFSVGIYAVRFGGEAETSVQTAQSSPVFEILNQAQQALRRGQQEEAYKVLTAGLEAHAADPLAGELQLLVADLEFSEFQHYDRAYEAYSRLRASYGDTFSQSSLSVERYNLLDEARTKQFEPLYELDRARGDFEDLERVLARYPASYVADSALVAMVELVRPTESDVPGTTVADLEKVRERCKDPGAVVEVNMARARTYWKDLNDPMRARDIFEEVAS